MHDDLIKSKCHVIKVERTIAPEGVLKKGAEGANINHIIRPL